MKKDMKDTKDKIEAEGEAIEEEISEAVDEIPLVDIDLLDSDSKKNNENKVLNIIKKAVTSLEFFFVAAILYLELIFHFVRFGFTAENLVQKLVFAVFYGLLIGAVVNLLPRLVCSITSGALTGLACVYFCIQIVYSGVFNTYLSAAGSIGMTNQAFDFKDVIWKEISKEWWVIVLLLIPLLSFVIYLRKVIDFKTHRLYRFGIMCAAVIFVFVVNTFMMNAGKNKMYSAYEIYHEYPSVDMAVQKLGVLAACWIDTKTGVCEKLGIKNNDVSFVAEDTGTTTEITTELVTATDTDVEITTEEELVIDTSPNILEVDFDGLIADTTSDGLKNLHTYISTVKPTNKNEYTGMFKDYNLIFVVAEGFSGYLIDEELTPTLYKMSHEGFVFENYYTPLWYGSTLGGEYADLTGLMPKSGGYLSMDKCGKNKNDMLFTLGKQLEKQGYTVTGFHDNDYTYYDRNISHPNMGYNWIGVGNGYEPERYSNGTQYWPQSDLVMIQNTFDLYKDCQPFHTYYLTVSGHVMYNFYGNEMCIKHKDEVADLPYSETTRAYLACQLELELALRKLNSLLEKEGIADNTLIVVTADHVPYNDKDILDELAGRELGNTFEWYENTLIIYSASMEEPVYVDKYCSSLDILPTVSNLMGLPYDSRMLVGQDILSDSEGVVMFNDRSFITDRASYDANTGEVVSIDGSEPDDDYIENMKIYVRNKFSMAEGICDYDYYKYIDEAVYGTTEE